MEEVNNVLIIAEAGVNHNGSLAMAKLLADAAKSAGADIVKFQLFSANKLAAASAKKAEYQEKNSGSGETQQEMLRKLELSLDEFKELQAYCQSIGIVFWATSFDADGTAFLVDDLGVRLLKVPSGEITDYPYLVDVATRGLPVILSCGMSTVEEIDEAVSLLAERGAGPITLLHCNTQYPTPFEDVNLRAMNALGERFNVAVGYSDHTPGIEVPIAAVALGAKVVEKHFTLDKTLEGPDHKASLDPIELKAMVEAIRNIEKALGSSEKMVTSSEEGNRAIARKSIVASRPISKGEVLCEDNLTTKRPGDGLSPMLWPAVVGQKAARDFDADEAIIL